MREGSRPTSTLRFRAGYGAREVGKDGPVQVQGIRLAEDRRSHRVLPLRLPPLGLVPRDHRAERVRLLLHRHDPLAVDHRHGRVDRAVDRRRHEGREHTVDPDLAGGHRVGRAARRHPSAGRPEPVGVRPRPRRRALALHDRRAGHARRRDPRVPGIGWRVLRPHRHEQAEGRVQQRRHDRRCSAAASGTARRRRLPPRRRPRRAPRQRHPRRPHLRHRRWATTPPRRRPHRASELVRSRQGSGRATAGSLPGTRRGRRGVAAWVATSCQNELGPASGRQTGSCPDESCTGLVHRSDRSPRQALVGRQPMDRPRVRRRRHDDDRSAGARSRHRRRDRPSWLLR